MSIPADSEPVRAARGGGPGHPWRYPLPNWTRLQTSLAVGRTSTSARRHQRIDDHPRRETAILATLKQDGSSCCLSSPRQIPLLGAATSIVVPSVLQAREPSSRLSVATSRSLGSRLRERLSRSGPTESGEPSLGRQRVSRAPRVRPLETISNQRRPCI